MANYTGDSGNSENTQAGVLDEGQYSPCPGYGIICYNSSMNKKLSSNVGERFRHNTDIGQNFLRDRSVVEWMIRRAGLAAGDRVLEIGPGEGILTEGILTTPCEKLDAIELDTRLRPKLEAMANRDARLTLHWADALRFDYSAIAPPPTHILANLPYHITTPLVWLLLENLAPRGTRYMLLMVQREAAQRLEAGAKSRVAAPLGITLAALGSVSVPRRVARGAFQPVPKVDSAIVEIVLSGKRSGLPRDRVWRRLLAASFATRRKTLVNNWSAAGVPRETSERLLAAHGLGPLARPEELALQYWLALYNEADFREVFGNSDKDARYATHTAL